jgi:hypothetical protein
MSDWRSAATPSRFRHAPEPDQPPYVLTGDSTSFDSRGP